MQQSAFNFDKLFSNLEQKEAKDFNKEVFIRASLLFEFSIESDFPNCNKDDLELLKIESCLKKDGRYFLKDPIRAKILTETIGIENIQKEIEKYNIGGDYARLLILLLNSKKIQYDNFRDDEIYYLLKLADLFPDKLDLEVLKNDLLRRNYFVPFREITKNFAGRKKELAAINDYIDWLPKQGLVNKTLGFFRNAINWHDKLPILIQGIGGIGKSSLISKIIIDNNELRKVGKLPFVYIDFDVPGFSLVEPMGLLLEAIRQLSFQFPKNKDIFSKVAREISSKTSFEYEANHSTQSHRGNIYNSIDNLLYQYELVLNQIKDPILVVFDSFEEIQYKASRTELSNFFSFIREISEKLPRIRIVFVGRSEIDESLADFKFDKIVLAEFDEDSALSLLEKYKITNKADRIKIFNDFGGNPLLLSLAADLVKKDPSALENLSKITEKKEKYLVNRILEHIHDPEVREMAVPGLLVRRITPDVIKHVLAPPCRLGNISIERATELFDELKKEVALISRSSEADEIIFRQDLRMACEDTVKSSYPTASQHIIRNAIAYYDRMKEEGEKYEAEFYFHILKEEEDIERLTKPDYLRLRTKLESALVELPDASKLYLRTLLGSQAETNIVNNSKDYNWSNYFIPQMKEGLNSNLDFLKKLDQEISSRDYDMQIIDPDFLIYDVLLKQRLNKISQSNDLIERFIKVKDDLRNSSQNFVMTYYQLCFLKAQNHEYNGEYQLAIEICQENYKTMLIKDRLLNEKFAFLLTRLRARTGKLPQKIVKDSYNLQHKYNDRFNNEFKDTNWNYVLSNTINYHFFNSDDFIHLSRKYQLVLTDISILEDHCYKTLGVYLKDIALAGDFQVLLNDYLLALEVRRLL
ncbi:hypothetical protein B4N84_07570 [Flavobacterium sp. IR1]|nr:hypothetical protein B4N84_07570 [Flavobacterium sp. IR1]